MFLADREVVAQPGVKNCGKKGAIWVQFQLVLPREANPDDDLIRINRFLAAVRHLHASGLNGYGQAFENVHRHDEGNSTCSGSVGFGSMTSTMYSSAFRPRLMHSRMSGSSSTSSPDTFVTMIGYPLASQITTLDEFRQVAEERLSRPFNTLRQ